MSPTHKPTPEEKLFAVIQGAHQASPRARAQALSLATVGMQLKTLAGAVDLPRVNQALSILVALLGVACLLNPLLLRPRVERTLARAAQHLSPFIIATPLEGLRSAEESLQLVRSQDPFRVGEAAPMPGAPPQDASLPAPPSPATQEWLQDLRLVGIAWGAEPRVMVEQISQGMTSVLQVGDAVGAFTVKEILEDRAVLTSGGQDVELF